MKPRKTYEIISLADFEIRIKRGERYTGLVEGVGYVHWKCENIYFIQINESELFALPVYRQIVSPYFGCVKSKKVYTKVSYTLFVLSSEELKHWDVDVYLFYYGSIELMVKDLVLSQDAIKSEKPVVLADLKREPLGGENSVRNIWNAFDKDTDVADEFGLISKRFSKYLSLGKTAINIVDNLGQGKYYDALGNVIMAFADFNIGIYIDAGSALIQSDHMQIELAKLYATECKRLEGEISRARQRGDSAEKIRRLEDREINQLNLFIDCMKKLGKMKK